MRALVSAVLLTLVAACATTSDTGPMTSRNVITAEEIAEVEARTAFEVIEKLRPAFLRRGRVNMGQEPGEEVTQSLPIVYVDEMRMGGVDELRRVRAMEVDRIEYMSASDATFRFGTGHKGGAILITTRRADGS